jgi:hypothetical protein
MKLNELIHDFTIYKTNEELRVLDLIQGPCSIDYFNERDRIILENLVRKSLVSKVNHLGQVFVVKNDT